MRVSGPAGVVRLLQLGIAGAWIAACSPAHMAETSDPPKFALTSTSNICKDSVDRYVAAYSRIRATVVTKDCKRTLLLDIRGRVTKVMAQEVKGFDGLLRKPGDKIVYSLNSPGGHVLAGADISDTIRNSKADTRVAGGASCASICALMFAAGKNREISKRSRIGFHSSYYGNFKPDREVNRRIAYLMGTQGASAPALRKLIDQTKPRDMTWIDAQDALRLGLATRIMR